MKRSLQENSQDYMINRRNLMATFAIAAALTGCAGDNAPSTEAAFTVRDSAGIRIADSPALQIGLADGAPEYLLSGVVSALRRADGTIVLVNNGSQEIRFYDGEGRHLRSVGGRGGGPGEFQQIFWVGEIHGDSLLVYDSPAQRVTTLSPEGDLVRAVTLDGFGTFPHIHSAFQDGSLIVRTDESAGVDEGTSGVRSITTIYQRVSPTGEALEVLHVAQPQRQYQAVVQSGEISGMTVVPELFGASTIVAPAGDSLFIGRNDRYDLAILSANGDLRGRLRYAIEPRPVTEAMVTATERARAEANASAPPSMGQTLMDEAMRNRPRADVLPFFMRALVDRAGNVWLQEHGVPGADAPPQWVVFESGGRLLGSLQMPERFTPRYIDDQYVLGVSRDEFDVERVQLYPIEKP